MIALRLKELGLTLPTPPKPAGAYIPAVQVGSLAWTAGMLPLVDGVLKCRGRIGAEVHADAGSELARICALNGLAALATVLDLNDIVRVVRVEGYVASAPDFHDQHLVLNGASELLSTLLGTAGTHTRIAVGAARLPLDAPVEVALTVALGT